MKFRDLRDRLKHTRLANERRNELDKLLRQVRELPKNDPMRRMAEPMFERCIEHEANGEYQKSENLLTITMKALDRIAQKQKN